MQTMHEYKAPIRPDWLFSGDMSEHAGFEVAQALLSAKDTPTAILCSSVLQAMGIQRALHLHDKILGKDVSIICWDDCLSGFHKSTGLPQFTSMQSSIYEAGAKIAHLLLDKIENPNEALSSQLLEAQLVIGQSTGKGPFTQDDYLGHFCAIGFFIKSKPIFTSIFTFSASEIRPIRSRLLVPMTGIIFAGCANQPSNSNGAYIDIMSLSHI